MIAILFYKSIPLGTPIQTSLNYFIDFIMHAFSGCDTTLAFYNQGEKKIAKLLMNEENLMAKGFIIFLTTHMTK